MKRQRAFLQTTQGSLKRPKTAAIVAWNAEAKLNSSQRAQVKRIVRANIEVKHGYAGVPTESISNVATIGALTSISQGDNDNQRIGNQVTLTYLHTKMGVVFADSTNLVRVIFFIWKPNDELGAPTAAQILGPGVSGPIDVGSFYNNDTKDTYRILYDRTFAGSSGTSNSKNPTFVDKKISLNQKVRYNGDTVTLGSGKVYRLMISDSNAISHPTVGWYSEFAFTDQ